MKKTHFLKFAVLLTSFAFFSCGDDDELPGKTERPEEPGDVATGVYGCSDEQKKNMEDIPGMGEIVETALGENGTYIYSDRNGNTCTLNKDGDMEMHGKDGSVTTRDHTIHQSTTAQATELTGKILVAEDRIGYDLVFIGHDEVADFLKEYPQLGSLIEVTQKVTPVKEIDEDEGDSINIYFQNEICIYETIKMYSTCTSTYNEVETTYTAHEGYVDFDDEYKLHVNLRDDDKMVEVCMAYSFNNPATGDVEYRDYYHLYYFYQGQQFIVKEDWNTACEYKYDPAVAEYFNYVILDNGDVKMTNQKKHILLKKKSYREGYENEENGKDFDLNTSR